jgi:hypothetical protein
MALVEQEAQQLGLTVVEVLQQLKADIEAEEAHG